ncbi:MAG: hypothetical protein J7501_05755, partial [Bdellovibrio sp.]|nr:hypothetical protein [Bdellovibrio sp.]
MSFDKTKFKKLCGSGGRWSLLLGAALLMKAPLAHAGCLVDNDEKIEINISPETQSWGDYLGRQVITASKVYKCEQESGRYLMISLGGVQWNSNTGMKENNMFGTYDQKSCVLESSKAASIKLNNSKTEDNFGRQYKFLRACVDIRVVDLGGSPIVAEDFQKYCEVERISDNAVTLRGDMCFLKIKPQNQFSVQPVLNPDCIDSNYLQKMGVQAQDIFANLNILTAGDDSGLSQDLDYIGSRPMHINITPNSKTLNLTEDIGTSVPRFPSTYSVDADWGPIKLFSYGPENTELDLSFFVSNMSDQKCFAGNCGSYSNYMQPFVGQIELYQLSSNKKPALIEEWWDGGLVPPNWQGFIQGIKYKVPDKLFTSGGRYRFVATFQNPTDDYAIFLNGLKQMLIRLYNTEGATVGIDTIPALSTLQELGTISGLGGLGSLNSNDQTVGLAQTMNGLEGIIKSTVWPPYYDSVCAGGTCTGFTNKKFYQRLVLEFTAVQMKGSSDITFKDMQMQKI